MLTTFLSCSVADYTDNADHAFTVSTFPVVSDALLLSLFLFLFLFRLALPVRSAFPFRISVPFFLPCQLYRISVSFDWIYPTGIYENDGGEGVVNEENTDSIFKRFVSTVKKQLTSQLTKRLTGQTVET